MRTFKNLPSIVLSLAGVLLANPSRAGSSCRRPARSAWAPLRPCSSGSSSSSPWAAASCSGRRTTGESWEDVSLPTARVHALAADPFNPDRVYAATANGVWVLAD